MDSTRRGAHRAALPAVPALLLALAACTPHHAPAVPTGSAPPPTAGAATAPPRGGADALPTGSSAQELTVGGVDRTYRIYRPAHLPAGPVPLVVMLHGALGEGRQAENSYGWDAEADRGGFVVAYPDGYRRTWDASADCCGPAAAQHVDDVGFITRLVSSVSGRVAIDPRRVYATGISNGGLLVYRLACDTSIFAAIGPDSATMINPCPSPAPISVIHVHGTADQTIPYNGGPGKRDNSGTGAIPVKIDGPPVPSLIATWRATDRCGTPSVSTTGQVTISTATCPDGRAVELVTIAGAGHQWPGQPGPRVGQGMLDPPSTALNATDVIWRFFAAHPKSTGS